MRSLASSHVAAPLRGRGCGAVAPRPSRHRRITPSSVPSGVPLCGLPFRESPASPVSPSGLRPFTLSPHSRHGSCCVPQRGVAAHRRSFRAGPGVAFGSIGRHAVACRSIMEGAAFLSTAPPFRVRGAAKRKTACWWVRSKRFPMSGNPARKSSNVRKIRPDFFQALERTACRPFQGLELHARGEEGGERNRGVMRCGYSAVFKTVSSSSLTNLCLDFGNRRSSSICCSIFDAGPGRLRWPVPLSSTRSTTDTPSTSAAR